LSLGGWHLPLIDLEPDAMPTATSLQPPRIPIAELRVRLRILSRSPTWCLFWEEPHAPADPRQWRDYLNHFEAVAVPLLRTHFPTWRAARTVRPVTIRAKPYGGVLRGLSDDTLRDAVRVFRIAFPGAVVASVHGPQRFADLSPLWPPHDWPA
jgi:hypothetical protein